MIDFVNLTHQESLQYYLILGLDFLKIATYHADMNRPWLGIAYPVLKSVALFTDFDERVWSDSNQYSVKAMTNVPLSFVLNHDCKLNPIAVVQTIAFYPTFCYLCKRVNQSYNLQDSSPDNV